MELSKGFIGFSYCLWPGPSHEVAQASLVWLLPVGYMWVDLLRLNVPLL